MGRICFAAFLIFSLYLSASATSVGMVLQTTRPQYEYGALILTYLSTNEKKELISIAANAATTTGVWGPSFSPDGKQIAYALNGLEIWTMNIDGSNKKKISGCGGKEEYLTWAGDGYIYWSQCDANIYRVKSDGSAIRQVIYNCTKFNTGNYMNNVHNLGVSQDGKHFSWTYPSWYCSGLIIDGTTKTRYEFGAGCHNPPSPDGTLFLHNQGGHEIAYVETFPDQQRRYTINPAEAGSTANLHRWSHSSNTMVMYTLEGSNIGYLHELGVDPDNGGTRLGTGIAWDYFAQEIHGTTTQPVIKLSPTSIAFEAQIGASASPAEVPVTVTNDISGTTLNPATVSGQPAWLITSISGTGNSQTIKNSVDITKVTAAGALDATVIVNSTGAASTASYAVHVTAFSQRDPENPTGATEPGLVYEYYEGSFPALPDFNAILPAAVDTIGTFSIAPAQRADNFAFRFTGFITIPADGNYTFTLNSDDGSRLYIGDFLVVDNGGIHTAAEKSGSISLKAGKHAIRVEYFQNTTAKELTVSMTAPGGAKSIITRAQLSHVPAPVHVLSPRAAQVYYTGDTMTISWNADCDQVPGVKIELSADNGFSWAILDESGSLACGTQTWKWRIPSTVNVLGQQKSTVSDSCIVKAANYNGGGEGVSGRFAIRSRSFAKNIQRQLSFDGLRVSNPEAGRMLLSIDKMESGTVGIYRGNGTLVKSIKLLKQSKKEYVIDRLTPGLYLISLKTLFRNQRIRLLVI